MKGKASPSFKSLDRALAILSSFSFSHPQRTASEIALCTSIPKSTVHRFLKVFVEHGFLKETTSPGYFAPGLKLLELGSIVHHGLDIRLCAQPIMAALAKKVHITVHLVIRDRDEGVYVEKVEPEGQHIHYSHIGKRIPLYCTAAGKVLLSELPDSKILEIIAFPLISLTPYTIKTKEKFLQEIDNVRKRGWAEDNQELELGLCCVAVPVKDHLGKIVAAMSSSGVEGAFTSEAKKRLVEGLRIASLDVSKRLGYRE
ncbi:MAG: IclR family transcriptional regulator [Aminobacterium sp.]|uniref:IclR family transcriptional regulator n=1 Tax=Aminobacterium sp. TaxID=1872491 RepID=UPI002B1F031A|nr:IclR family transcriptional regulator [Aminobacterium sp.]MEA4877385.1 IclR family transcriptional regulator [Aminobacterium sp.]